MGSARKPEYREAHTFTEEPEPDKWVFSHCPCDLDENPDVSCEGCAGWGLDCGAFYIQITPRNREGNS